MSKAPKPKAVVLASRFNESLTRVLVSGAVATLTRHGIPRERIRVVWVPGAFELPLAAAEAARRLHPALMVAVGCLIKGQTPQYAAIGHAVTEGLCEVSVRAGIPLRFGVVLPPPLPPGCREAPRRAPPLGRPSRR